MVISFGLKKISLGREQRRFLQPDGKAIRSIARSPRARGARPARGQFQLIGIARPARECWSRKSIKQLSVV